MTTAVHMTMGVLLLAGPSLALIAASPQRQVLALCTTTQKNDCYVENPVVPYSVNVRFTRPPSQVLVSDDSYLVRQVGKSDVTIYGLHSGLNVVDLTTIDESHRTFFTMTVQKTIPSELLDIKSTYAKPTTKFDDIIFNYRKYIVLWEGSRQRVVWAGDVGVTHKFLQFGGGFLFQRNGSGLIEAMDYAGNLSTIFDFGDHFTTHHDFVFTDRGTLLVLVDDNSSNTIEDKVAEVDLRQRRLIRLIDLKGVLATRRPAIADEIKHAERDWLHANSLFFDSARRQIVISSRNQSAVFALDYKGATINWIFADPAGWERAYQPLLIKNAGGFTWPSGQHQAELQGDRLVVFDNKAALRVGEAFVPPGQIASAVRSFKLDQTKRLAHESETFGKQAALFSIVRGGYDFTPVRSRILVCFATVLRDPFGMLTLDRESYNIDDPLRVSWRIEERDSFSGELLRAIDGKGFSYRASYSKERDSGLAWQKDDLILRP